MIAKVRVDPTVTFGHLLTISSFVVTVSVAAAAWHMRLVTVEAALLNLTDRMAIYETHRIERDDRLMVRLERIEDRLEGKANRDSDR